MSERLDRIERNIEAIADQVKTIAEMSAKNEIDIQRLTEISARHDEQIQANNRHIETLAQSFVDIVEVIRLMRTDIQGLRFETQRVINHLFGENQE
jgi:hypothetical protein